MWFSVTHGWPRVKGGGSNLATPGRRPPVRSRHDAADRPPARVRARRGRADPRSGPSVLFVVTRSLTLGRGAGVATVVGNSGRRLRAGRRRRVRPRRARAGVDHRLQRRSSSPARLPRVPRRADVSPAAARSPRRSTRRSSRKLLRRILADGVRRRDRQPEGHRLLHGGPAAVRRSRRRVGGAAAADARRDLLRHRARLRQHVGAARGGGARRGSCARRGAWRRSAGRAGSSWSASAPGSPSAAARS